MNSRKTALIYLSFILLVSIASTNRSANPPDGRTGAPGETTCSSCHSTPPAGVQGNISIQDLPATVSPGSTYTLTVSTKATMGNPTISGFQLVVLDENDQNIGDLVAISTDEGTNTASNGREYIEHRGPQTFTDSLAEWTFNWIAPASGSGNIKLYAASILANANSSTAGDAVVSTMESTVLVSPPSASVSTTDVFCFEGNTGTATASATGGTPPYSYLWSNGASTQSISNLFQGSYTVTITDAIGMTATASGVVNQASEINISLSTNQVNCNGLCDGSITATVSGGVGGYTFIWNDPFSQLTAIASGLCAGEYEVTVTDANSCTKVASAIISEPASLNIVAQINNVLCHDDCNGAIDISVTGGTSPYTYFWEFPDGSSTITEDINDLCPGTYTLTLTDRNNCSVVENYTLNNSAVLVISTSATDVSCFGDCDGTATASVTGGNLPLVFLWDPSTGNQASPTAVNLCPGTYSVTVSDQNGCTEVANATVGGPTEILPNTTATAETGIGLNDGTATAAPSGGTPGYTFLWSNGGTTATITNLSPASYTVTVTDANACISVQTVTVDPATCQLQIIFNTTDVSCNGSCDGSIDLSIAGGSPPYSYNWSPGLSNTQNQVGLCAGIYQVTVNDGNACTATASIPITEPDEISLTVTAVCESGPGVGDGSASNTASGGTPSYSYLWSNGATTSSIDNLFPGIYFLTLTDANGCFAVDSDTVCLGTCNLMASVTAIDLQCNGDTSGVAIATPVNGTPPYSFLWSTGGTSNPETGLAAGTYSVDIRDADNCLITVDVIIAEPAPLSASINAISGVSCNGASDGVASVTPGGGTGPYTVSWSNGGSSLTQNNLPATGTVRVVDDNGCNQTFPYSLPEPAVLTVDMSASPETVLGELDGTATATPAGGTPPYTYLWNTGATSAMITDLAPGTYSVVLTDANDCTAENTVEVEAGGCNLVLSSFEVENILCAGTLGSATITVTGGSIPYRYLWSSGGMEMTETGLVAGNYSVTVLDNNDCVVSRQFSITEIAPLNLGILFQDNVECSGDSSGLATVVATGGSSPYSYAWPTGGTGATEDSLTNTTYLVSITDGNQCRDTVSVTIEVMDNTLPTIQTQAATLYLNAQGSADLSLNQVLVSTMDNCGIDSTTINQNQFDCSHLGENTVYLKVFDNNGNCTLDSALVTVLDSIAPQLFCPDDFTSFACDGIVDYSIDFSDNCPTGNPVLINGLASGAVFPFGQTSITYALSDASGNADTCSFTITLDNQVIDYTVEVIKMPCVGQMDGSAEVFPIGGQPPYTYLWDDAQQQTTALATDLPAGVYNVRVSDSLACDTTILTVNLANSPAVDIVLEDLVNATNGEANGSIDISISGGIAPYSFLWNTGETTEDLVGVPAGTYTLEVRDANDCIFFSSQIEVENITGLVDPLLEAAILLFPNPNDGQFKVQFTGQAAAQDWQLEVIDIQGRVVEQWNKSLVEQTLNLDYRHLAEGVYFLRLQNETGIVIKKLVVSRT